jgi:HAD superfamily hydrolase (TIGR01662 family)
MYSTYLFDWDGSLANTLEVWLRIHRDIFQHFGLEFNDKKVYEKILADVNFEKDIGVNDPQFIADKYAEAYRLIDEGVELNEGAIELLTQLRAAGKKLAIVTGSNRPPVERVLEKCHMLDVLYVIISVEDTKLHKPNPQPLIKALEKMGVTKEGAVMVGDTYFDMNAGKALGIDTILYHHPGFHDEYYDLADQVRENPPTHIVANLLDILKL